MYKDGFVLSILKDGKPLNEIEGIVRIPFDSEYQIRLRNKNWVNCKAKVYIDGAPVSQLGNFVINSQGVIDLERFLDSSLDEGARFKFVHKDHGEVSDPDNEENGVIRVEFYKASSITYTITTNNYPYSPWIYHDYSGARPWGSDDSDTLDWSYSNDNKTSDGDGTLHHSGGGTRSMADGVQVQNCSAMYCSTPTMDSFGAGEEGATVGGSKSHQKFHTVADFLTETFPTVLELKLLAPKDKHYVAPKPRRFCSQCGSKVQRKDRFCSSCGTKLN
jgi:hypothetical protein